MAAWAPQCSCGASPRRRPQRRWRCVWAPAGYGSVSEYLPTYSRTCSQVGYGYVVESRKEVELPEVMACCCRIVNFDLAKAVPFPPQA